MNDLSLNIIILNYNGAELIPRCVPSILEAARRSPSATQVTILDNLSSDKGIEDVVRTFPEVVIERAEKNLFLCSYNDYLKKISQDIVLLLNNDIRVDKNFIAPLVRKFQEDPGTFLAAPRVMSFDGSSIEAAASKAGIRFGLFWCKARYPGYEREALKPSFTYSSGFGAFSRAKFLELEGYDPRYLPGIMEDVDLSYRAQKKGYGLYYVPESVVYHIGQATFKKAFGEEGLKRLAHRNTFIFMWKNFTGFSFWFSHLFFLPFRLLYAFAIGNRSFIQGFFDAIKKILP